MSSQHAFNRGILWVALGSASLLLGVGCGGEERLPARTPRKVVTKKTVEREAPGPSSVSSELGGMNETLVEKEFQSSLEALLDCVHTGASRVEFLGGTIGFWGKVSASGRLEHVHAEKSTLGDRETERCMFHILQARRWPKPLGGSYGVIQKSFDFDPPKDVREPVLWEATRVRSTVAKLAHKITGCKGDTKGPFEATVYVNADGSVLAAGLTPPDEAGDKVTDCLINELRAAKFPSPGSWPAKVTFQLK